MCADVYFLFFVWYIFIFKGFLSSKETKIFAFQETKQYYKFINQIHTKDTLHPSQNNGPVRLSEFWRNLDGLEEFVREKHYSG